VTLRKSSALIAVFSALFFSLLYAAGMISENLDFFIMTEDRVYDLFLHVRPRRERIDNVVFLDVDDLAIAHVGVFPWPRSVMADGLLRLKEYGVRAAIFDIEYIDKSPPGLDAVYLSRSLPGDFRRSFQEISSNVDDIFGALAAGRLTMREALDYAKELGGLIDDEQNSLLGKVEGIARDNDEYLAAAAKLLGRTFSTLNLQEEFPLTGEQAQRRFLAEKKFSWPLDASPEAYSGFYHDILSAIPAMAEAAKGAGFTNVTIDKDGVRRRIYLSRKVGDYWYLQLTLPALMEYLGNPAIRYEKGKLVLKDAEIPGGNGGTRRDDIVIPLDGKGAMMLDWPSTNYIDSFSHISFAQLSYLEENHDKLEQYFSELSTSEVWFFPDDKGSLFNAHSRIENILELYGAARDARRISLDETSDAAFDEYITLKNTILEDVGLFLDEGPEEAVKEAADFLAGLYTDQDTEQAIVAEISEYALDYIKALKELYGNITENEAKLKKAFQDKFCIMGRSDTGTTDIGVNPFWGRYVNVGTHAVVLDTIISQSFIRPLSSIWSMVITLIFVPLILLLLSPLKPGLRAGLGFGAAAFFFLISLGLFYLRGIFLGPLGFLLAMISAVTIRELVAFMGSEQEKRFIRKAFSTYLSGDVVEEILSDPSRLQLGGSKRHMTAIFTDIKGFSTISEKLDPEDLVKLLNRYLSAMSNIVLNEHGVIDKFEGDAIIAFFGAPIDLSDHALRACVSAILMKRTEAELNVAFAENGLSPAPLNTRIGINTGSMVVGNMGTENKMDYTIMGNAVNLAARLEGVNKQYNTWILASGDTVKETGGALVTRRVDRVRVVGINEPVELYELLDLRADAKPEIIEKAELFQEALGIFEKRNWQAAGNAFRKVLDISSGDGPSQIYIERCEAYMKTPPGDDWDGVFNLTQK
jgi:adenylate cyclase